MRNYFNIILSRWRRAKIKPKRNFTWSFIMLAILFMLLRIIYHKTFTTTYTQTNNTHKHQEFFSIYSVVNQDKVIPIYMDNIPGKKDIIPATSLVIPDEEEMVPNNRATISSNKNTISSNSGPIQSKSDIIQSNSDIIQGKSDTIKSNSDIFQGNGDKIRGNRKLSKVLIVGYMKGGSSLMGEVFNQNAAAMYWFEPLFGFYGDLYNMVYSMAPWLPKQHRNGTLRKPPIDEETKMVAFFQNLFTCNPNELPIELLASTDFVMQGDSISFQEYINCTAYNYNSIRHAQCKQPVEACHEKYMRKYLHESCKTPTEFNLTLKAHRQIQISKKCLQKQKQEIQPCLGIYEKSCRSVDILAAKTIRLSMRMVETLLQWNPDLKIIHYVRDPRGIQESRGLRSMFGFNFNITESGRHLCSLMRDDISMAQRLNMRYPDTMIQVKYEDLALNNEDTIQRIYKHIGQEPPESLLKWFKTVGHTCNSAVEDCTRAYARQGRWAQRLSDRTLKVLSLYCEDVLQYFNYEVIL